MSKKVGKKRKGEGGDGTWSWMMDLEEQVEVEKACIYEKRKQKPNKIV